MVRLGATGTLPAMTAGLSADQVSRLVTAAASVASATDLTSALRGSVTTGRDLTGARYAALGILGRHGSLVDFVHVGMDAATVARIGHLPEGRGVLGTITRVGETVRIDKISQHPDSVGFPAGHPPMDTFLGVPVRIGDDVFGNLYLTEKRGGFSDYDQAMVEAMAVIAGAAVSTARLQQRLRRVAVIEDRERIARDLHDAIIQDLFAVGLGLQGIAQRIGEPAVAGRLEDAVERLDLAIASLRRFIFDLKPSGQATLEQELRALCDRLAAPYGAEVDLELAIPDPVPLGLTDDLLRMVGESVSNALRHSGVGTVEVRVEEAAGTVAITVVDHGIGFDTSKVRSGSGLPNLRARAELLGGSLSVDSAPTQGTAVRIILPA
jgi:signal transduction histidine kinase